MYDPTDPDEHFHNLQADMRGDQELRDKWRDLNLTNEIALRGAVEHPTDASTDASYDQASKHYWQGIERKNKGDFHGAIKDFAECDKYLKDRFEESFFADIDGVRAFYDLYASLFNKRAIARCGKGDFGGAINDFDEAIRLQPPSAALFFNRGKARKPNGDF